MHKYSSVFTLNNELNYLNKIDTINRENLKYVQ